MTRIAVGAALLVSVGYALATTSLAGAEDPVPTVTVTTTTRVAASYHGRPIWRWYNVARYQRSQSRAYHRQSTRLGVRVRRLQDVVRGLRARLRPKRTPVPSADYGKWAPIYACERGRDGWATNTGNGFEGGLQIWPPNWTNYGGLKYASHAYLATAGQQIAIAEKILADQGWGAWPTCAARAGYR